MENNAFGLHKGVQVFVSEERNGPDINLSYGGFKKDVECNLNHFQKFFQTPSDFSSGDDCSTKYEIEMENTIIQQNNAIMALEEALETKDRTLNELQEELTRKNALIQEMEETILTQNDSIEHHQDELRKKEEHIKKLEETISNQIKRMDLLDHEVKSTNEILREMKEQFQNKEAVIKEAEGLKIQISDLTNQVKSLEDVVRVKNEAIQRSTQWHIEMKKEFEAHSSSVLKREETLTLEHNKEIEKLKQDFLEQFKLINEKKSSLEAFLENQVDVLINRLQECSQQGYGSKKDIESFCGIYKDELKKLKLIVDQFSDRPHTDNFIKRLEEFNKNLALCFLHEEDLNGELNSKKEELKMIQDELKQCKKMCDEVMSNEKQLFTKLTQTEIELNKVKDEKVLLQQRLTEANNKYEKVTIDFNRDRMESDKKYRQALDSYETDLIILNKSLQELLCNVPTNVDYGGCFLGSGDSSLVSLNADVNSMISNPSIFNAQKIVLKCLYELGKLRSEIKKMNQESKAMRLAIEVKNKAFAEKEEQLRKLCSDFEHLQNKYSEIENEKKYLENKLKYMVEENTHLNLNIESLNSEIADLNDAMKNYQEERKKTDQKLKSGLSLSPIVPEPRIGVVSDSELISKADLQTPDISFQSLPDALSQDPIVYSSTPFHNVPCDLEGGGEFVQSKIQAHSDFQVSLLKWIEKCHELDKENKLLFMKIEDLQLLNQDLNFSLGCVKEEMDIFQEKQKKLETKLNRFVTLKNHLVSVCNESGLKDQQIKSLMKEIGDMTNENTELFHKNLELEEMYRKTVSKLTDIKQVQNIGAFTDSIANTFNEKVKEIIRLKGEINSLKDEKKSLSRKVDLLLESNNCYITKLKDMSEQLGLCQDEQEKADCEKLEGLSNNNLLKKEIELLQQRVNFLSNLRDSHWCNPSSMQLFEDMHQEVLLILRNSCESKLNIKKSPGSIDSQKDSEKLDPLNLPELLKMLSTQLRDEKLDFEQKVTEFQHIINSVQDGNTLNDTWFVQIDKMLRNVLEELKYHKEQYCRIEEALRSTGKFHDELQKQKDELRIKEHEINGIQKKFEEEKMKSRKNEVHLKMIEQDIVEKNDLIKALTEERDNMEKDILGLKKELSNTELKYLTNLKTVEWNKKLEELRKSKKEIDEKIIFWENAEKNMECRDSLTKGLEEAEELYQKAVDEVKAFLQAEMSNNIVNIQEEHKEQVQ